MMKRDKRQRRSLTTMKVVVLLVSGVDGDLSGEFC